MTRKRLARYVLETDPGEYLRHVGGDWGPDHLPTKDIAKAVRFESAGDAYEYLAENWGGSAKAVKVWLIPEEVELA